MEARSDGLTLRGVLTALGLGALLIALLSLISVLGGSDPAPAQASAPPPTVDSSPGDDSSTATSPATTPAPPTTPIATSPQRTTPESRTLAISSADAQSNARDVLALIEGCFTKTADYSRCTTADQLGAAGPAIVGDPPGPGAVAITATERGYLVRAADAQRQLWGIQRRAETIELRRTCHLADGVTPCPTTADW